MRDFADSIMPTALALSSGVTVKGARNAPNSRDHYLIIRINFPALGRGPTRRAPELLSGVRFYFLLRSSQP